MSEHSAEIAAPSPGHVCSLPWRDGGYGATGYPEGHLMQCRAGCGRWWRCAPCFRSYGPITEWVRVRWFNALSRRRIKASLPTGSRGDA